MDEWLVEDEYGQVLLHPGAPQAVVDSTVDSEWYLMRQGVARNLGTPVDVLAALADDKHIGVRMALAENPNLPGQARARLGLG